MKRNAYTALGVLIPSITVLSCDAAPVSKVIIDNTLGGSWFVQTVGQASIKASVELSVKGQATRDLIRTIWSSGSNIKIEYDGYMRTGIIMTEPTALLVRPGSPEARRFSVNFSLAVMIEEVSP